MGKRTKPLLRSNTELRFSLAKAIPLLQFLSPRGARGGLRPNYFMRSIADLLGDGGNFLTSDKEYLSRERGEKYNYFPLVEEQRKAKNWDHEEATGN